VAEPAPPSARESARLVEKLGSPDFAEREAATKRLDELGPQALDDLRAACKSEDPEIADRAKDLVRKIERRVASARTLAPTLVELDAKDVPLDDVLAALSKQIGYDVVLGGPKADELAAKKLSVTTGKVPFWTAVVQVCEAADLKLAVAGGFVAPGSLPYRGRANQPRGAVPGAPLRVASKSEEAVVLEARGAAKKRPACVHGAVLVEAVELPNGAANPDASAAVLQFWPEPKIMWEVVARTKVTKATDEKGQKLLPDVTIPPPAPAPQPGIQPVGLGAAPVTTVKLMKVNVRQTVVKFQPGAERFAVARELTGTAYAVVRSAVEPVVTIALDPQKAVTVTGQAGTEVTAALRTDAKGKRFVDVTLSLAHTVVNPVSTHDELPDGKPAARGGNRTITGVQVTDADGEAFALALANQESALNHASRRIVVKLTVEPVVAKDGPREPARVVFWGTVVKPVEIPFALKDVPLVGGGR
jgi:hypothetical protein